MGRFHWIGEEYTDVESETLKLMSVLSLCLRTMAPQFFMHSILLSIVASPATTGQMGTSIIPVWKFRAVQGRNGKPHCPQYGGECV
jgi:hypothetical protein